MEYLSSNRPVWTCGLFCVIEYVCEVKEENGLNPRAIFEKQTESSHYGGSHK